MSWDWIWWVIGITFALAIVAAVMNIVWGTEEESQGSKNMLIQLVGGAATVVVVVLLMTFVVKPTMVFIAQQIWNVFN